MPSTLYPFVCFDCRKSFKRVWPEKEGEDRPCPECGGKTIGLARKFKPPAKDDIAQWNKVRYLVEHGFRFGSVRDASGTFVRYPETMKEAIDFVARYKHTLSAREASPSKTSLRRPARKQRKRS